jgi:DNA-directed RNA polymerase specialized sigma24 family protein
MEYGCDSPYNEVLMETDQQLIQDAAQGNTQAFAVLYERYRDWVYRLAWRFTGDRDLALDVLQETWIPFPWQSMSSYSSLRVQPGI